MAQILKVEDLNKYSIALRNSGVTTENLQMLERQVLVAVFGKEGARNLVIKINDDTDSIKEFLDGDDILFSGLKALLSTIICINLISQNRMQVARQNVTKQPVSSRPTDRREESDVVQALSYSAKSLLFAMNDYLGQEGKNPLNLKINDVILETRYSTNTSGQIPAATPFMGFLRW